MDYLRISRTYGELGVKTIPAKLKIHSIRPRFTMKQKPPEMVVNRKPARVVIDQSQAFADRGNKTIFRLMDEFAKWAADICAEAIERIAAEGTKIAKAGASRGEIMRQILIERMTERKTEVNIAVMSAGPEVKWEEGFLEINWIIHPPEIEWEVSARAQIETEPHSLEIYVRKHPSLTIEVVAKENKHSRINRKI